MTRWLEEGAPHVWRPYCQHKNAPPPLPVVRAYGSRLVLADGRELVDGLASWWTACHGYQHPHIQARIAQQASQLMHVAFGGLAHEAAYTLATRLVKLLPAPLERVFFADSGSVAVEVAVKMCVQAARNRGEHRREVLAFRGGYHGDTALTMRLSDPGAMHAQYADWVEALPVRHLDVPQADDAGLFEQELARAAPTLAAVIVEPLVQAANSMRFFDEAALRRIRAACTAHGVPLILDEVATGFFRTGARFAMDRAGVVPDVVVLGKALTGGALPLACAVASRALFQAFLGDSPELALQHGPTFMGNALACAAAHASLDLFEREDYGARVAALENKLRAGLARFARRARVRDVRVRGAIGVIELEPGSAPASAAFAAHGAFVRPLRFERSDVVYLMPPLVIEDEDLAVLFAAIERALGS